LRASLREPLALFEYRKLLGGGAPSRDQPVGIRTGLRDDPLGVAVCGVTNRVGLVGGGAKFGLAHGV
jgi:hypothetical protein